MVNAGSLPSSHELGIFCNYGYNGQSKRQDAWSIHIPNSSRGPLRPVPTRCKVFLCRSLLTPSRGNEIPVLKTAATVLTRSYSAIHGSPLALKLIPAVGIIAFAAWGLGPLMRMSRILFLHKNDSTWKKSSSHYVLTSYVQPLLLWSGATLVCSALDPVILPSEASQAVKQRLLNFVRSLSTVLAFAYCLSSLIQQTQKFFVETKDTSDAKNMGFEFAGKAIYSAVWVASVSLFMELLGFSTQKWLTAGGLGTVLLTLAGREIFTNFLSSLMIHATRPFVANEWIQTKIEGYEVSGTVEHMGWWSPTIIRGDDREAVHIPNHKFTVNVVRNLSQKTHWRIKTHLAISHLDVNKINNIVADLRKVLAKNPQVEQQKLHRRVFLDNVDSESQALLIMVSCFVKTSHFEEYLCVKEAILLDLLRVISHHRARLATPIRTVQKIYSEADVENVPFSDTIFTRTRASTNRSFLLVEPSYKINGDDKTKLSTRPVRTNDEKDAKVGDSATSEFKAEDKVISPPISDANTNANVTATTSSDTKTTSNTEKQEFKKSVIGDASIGSSEDVSSGGASSGKPPHVYQESGSVNAAPSSAASQAKQDGERSNSSPSIARPALKDNIVLGVALDGSKRMLPIDEETTSSPTLTESKELAACRNGNGNGNGSPPAGKDTNDDQIPAIPGVAQSDQREKER